MSPSLVPGNCAGCVCWLRVVNMQRAVLKVSKGTTAIVRRFCRAGGRCSLSSDCWRGRCMFSVGCQGLRRTGQGHQRTLQHTSHLSGHVGLTTGQPCSIFT